MNFFIFQYKLNSFKCFLCARLMQTILLLCTTNVLVKTIPMTPLIVGIEYDKKQTYIKQWGPYTVRVPRETIFCLLELTSLARYQLIRRNDAIGGYFSHDCTTEVKAFKCCYTSTLIFIIQALQTSRGN